MVPEIDTDCPRQPDLEIPDLQPDSALRRKPEVPEPEARLAAVVEQRDAAEDRPRLQQDGIGVDPYAPARARSGHGGV